ncbi:hypothetical protein [Sulfurovum riftiae]|uniref:Type I restriction enzyme R protein N-terminal domain-containing protein n=1 Tax=Sulfurovum riftiae TaxID=1630136 RepID=A0A151CGL0_9BACT|nr:hypothetical protein [Sulfurovum riftiae]KYJ86641.1 hypothetical protein AS592_11790 [Sulfurovum riftiae]
MGKSEIKKIIDYVLVKLLKNDSDILEIDINERTISHRFAVYLEKYFDDWSVDCEYNRDHDNKKTLNIDPSSIETNDTNAQTVFPDIIVHKRRTDENLLVIEMKKSTNTNSDNRDKDIKKLRAFKRELNYQFAVFINIGVDDNSGKNTVEFIEV